MSDNGNGCEDCCKIPVCLEFQCASATDEFKEAMKEIFSEIFNDLCNGDNGNGDNGDNGDNGENGDD